ncbi:MAG: hypothetical protein QXH35_08780 [Nitrososphaerota archaeon]
MRIRIQLSGVARPRSGVNRFCASRLPEGTQIQVMVRRGCGSIAWG